MLVSRETGAPTVRRQEWSSDQEGLQQHAQLETTHWSAPTQSYGKMVAGVAVRSGGHAVHARRQVEVMSARAPGSLRVLRATVTTSHSSSTSTQGHRTFDDLKMLVNPLDISSQRDRSSIGRSGALGARRPPSRIRPAPALAAQVTREAREGLERLTSPSIVANGISKLSNSSSVDIVEVRSDSDKRSNNSDEKRESGTKYKVNYPDNESEESFYDSCPEKDSIFKDESEQLEEWRRSSKIRRSLQFPRRSPAQGKCLDLPDNWGSVSRIKRELESVQNIALFPKNLFHNPCLFGPTENSVIREEETESTNTESIDTSFSDTFLVKPSTLKTKSFISLETLNEVRGRLKNFSTEVEGESRVHTQTNEKDDGIEAEINPPIAEDNSPAEPKVTRVRSYVFGMEAMLNAQNEKKQNYPGGSNSLESRVSKITSASSNRNDDWYMRRKSYGFEKVANKSENNSLTNHDKNNIESSTDSGICQSSELVNSLSNGGNNRSTVVTLGQSEKRETFEDWLQKNRKSFASNKYKCLQDEEEKEISNQRDYNRPDSQHPDITSVHVPVKPDDSTVENNNKQLFFRKLSEGTTLSVETSSVDNSTKSEAAPFAFKRHTIAVDGIKEIRDFYEPKNSVTKTLFSTANSGLKFEENSEDSTEKKSKKVEFCKTEVHFTAESGRVNIVESEGKPPSTNNFRRRRRSSGVAAVKEDKNNKLPVTRFGDSVEDNKVLGIEDITGISSEKMKLNYAVITEIKSTAKDSQKPAEKKDCPSIVQINGDLSEVDQPRGILKNKPIKPRPYLLGEDPEAPTESEAAEQNLWGVKLRPVKRTEEPSIWKSSVLLNNEPTDDIPNDCLINTLGHDETSLKSNKETRILASVSEVSKVNKGLLTTCKKINLSNGSPNIEAKGYSTKVNFGNGGDAVIETSFRQSENKHDFVKSEDCLVRSNQQPTNMSSINRINSSCKAENVTTKISIDLSPTKADKTAFKQNRTSIDDLFQLKSTALVKNTFSKREACKTNSNMVLIGESDRCFVKTAYKSKLRELRKMYDNRECSEDSADEEVRSLMGRSGGLSWGSLRGVAAGGAQGSAGPPGGGGSLSWSRRRAQRTVLPQCAPLTAIHHDTKPLANNPINSSHTLISTGYKEIFDNGRNPSVRPDRTQASSLASQQNIQKNHIVTEKKQIFDKSVTSLNTAKKATSVINKKDSTQAEDKNQTTFADSISTPRSLMPARGSARKLKQHELSYFGVTDSHSRETSATKTNTFESKDKNTKISNTPPTNTSYTKSNYPLSLNTSSEVRKYEPRTESPIYENLVINSTNTDTKPTKVKHPGESIIEELTKAADEILQALNGYSDEESSHVSSGDDGDPKNKNRKRSIKPLETISETFTRRAKAVETKAVQADYGIRERNRSQLATSKKVGSKNSSNSSIESIARDSKNSTHRVKSKVVENIVPEKPQRKKVSSVEAVKARRLHRANSRDALYQIHGSSSEDLPGNMVDVVKKKSSRRSKYGDVKSTSNASINIHSSSTVIDENKDSKYSSRTLSTVLPEIRHRTAVSTIKAVERNGTKDKTSSRTKSSTKERSRRREKLQEGTISSLNRVRVLHREKSRSADTSLDRETGHQRERVRAKDTASYHGDESYDPIKVRHSSSRVGSQSKTQSHKEESHDKVKTKESSPLHRDRTLRSDKDGSHDKVRVRDPSDHGHRAHVRDTSSHRRDRSQDKAAKELLPHQGERYDERARVKEHSSHHRDRDRSKDKRRERESSTLHRDRSQDSGRLRTPQIAKKKTLLSGSSNLVGASSHGHERESEGAVHPPTHPRPTRTRTEHDKSLR